MAEAKNRQQTELKPPSQEQLIAQAKEDQAKGEVDLAKGSGFIEIPVLSATNAATIIKYPALCFRAMGIAAANLEAAIEKIDMTSVEYFFPARKKPAKDNKGVTNRLQGTFEGKIIGKSITFKLPTATQRGTAKGKPQLYVSTRVPGFVPVEGMGILQAWLNSAVTDEAKKIRFIYGPSRRIRWTVPPDAAAIAAAIKEMAETEEIPF